MTNPEADDKTKTSGFLVVSINLIGPGDEAAQLKLGTDKEVNAKKPWMPTNVVKKYKQFYFKLIKAENLPVMDTFGTIDAFIKFELDKKSKVKTKVVKMRNSVVNWNQELLVPVELPVTKDSLDFELYDEDLGVSSELVANLHFSIKEIIKNVGGNPKERRYHMQWFNLYGSNPSESNKYSEE